MDDVGVAGENVLKVDVADAEEALVFETFALGAVRQGLVDGSPMLKNIAYCHSRCVGDLCCFVLYLHDKDIYIPALIKDMVGYGEIEDVRMGEGNYRNFTSEK